MAVEQDGRDESHDEASLATMGFVAADIAAAPKTRRVRTHAPHPCLLQTLEIRRLTQPPRSAHLKTAGRNVSHDRHFGQRQYQPTLFSPHSSH